MNIKDRIIQFLHNVNAIYVEISNENINTVHDILFNEYNASLCDHIEILYYYALHNHIKRCYNIAFIYYTTIINKNITSEISHENLLIGCTFNNLGLLYRNGYSVEENLQIAIQYYELAIKYNVKITFHNIADLYIDLNVPKAIEFYEKSITLGNYSSIRTLANLYRDGHIHRDGHILENTDELYNNIISRNIDKTINIYEKAINDGFHKAYSDLASIYAYTNYGKYNPNKAIELFKKSVMSHNQLSTFDCCTRALEYITDKCETKNDIDTAIELCENEIKKNNQFALFQLAQLYVKKRFGSKPPHAYIELYETSIHMNNHSVMNSLSNLGLDDHCTNYIKNNPEKMLKLFHLALDKNNTMAPKCIGVMYEMGLGVNVNLDMAAKYYAIHCEGAKNSIHDLIKFQHINWTKQLHKFWPINPQIKENLYDQIFMLLLISKNRNKYKLSKFFVNGICLIVVNFLMKILLDDTMAIEYSESDDTLFYSDISE